jgi:septum formation protein
MVAGLGIPFAVLPAEVDEAPRPGEAPGTYLVRIVDAKLEAVRAVAPAGALAVLVADTAVVAGGSAILGKPRDDADARSMLERLSGQVHEVSTRFCLAPVQGGTPSWRAETVTTRVVFRTLGRDEIEAYVATGECRDKAGAYAIQGAAAGFVRRIEGSYTNVVGLPLCEVIEALRAAHLLGPAV